MMRSDSQFPADETLAKAGLWSRMNRRRVAAPSRRFRDCARQNGSAEVQTRRNIDVNCRQRSGDAGRTSNKSQNRTAEFDSEKIKPLHYLSIQPLSSIPVIPPWVGFEMP
jgi:hypothetical protein